MPAVERRSKPRPNGGPELEASAVDAALRESEDRYRRLVELSPEPIAVHQEGRWVFLNRAAAALFGAREPDELIGLPVLDFIHPDYRSIVFERIRRVLEEGGTAELIEEKFLTVDGEAVDVEVFAMPTTFNGRPAYQLMARDIRERKRAEAARRQAEERFRNLFENAVFGVFQTTTDGRFTNANHALARMFGYESPEDLIERVTDIGTQIHVDPNRRAEFARLLETEGAVSGFDATARRRDGSHIEISLSGRAVKDDDGNVIAFEGIVEDVSMRKLAEDQLREQKRVLETIEQVGALLASELDLTKTGQAVIDAATELTGAQFGVFAYRAADESGQYVSRQLVSGGNAPAFAGPAAAEGGGSFETFFGDLGVLRSDDITLDPGLSAAAPRPGPPAGATPVRSYLAVPVIARSGDVIGGLFFGHEQAAAFNEHHETLAAGIARWAGIALDNARLYNEAQQVQEQLRRANEAKDEFLGMVSHELRTPITTIYGGARLLQSRADRLDKERQEDVLSDIEQEAERLYRLVEDLLALARMELGAAGEMRPVLLQRTADKIVAAFMKRRPNRKLEVRIPDDLPTVLADATYVEQILRNLLGNADKYSPADEPITLSAEPADGEVVVRVQDRGPGLEPEEMEAIFERFYRAERTARQASGLGIGLTVCKRLVEVQGGRIWAESPGRGLAMSFTVPLADEPDSD